MNTPEEQHAELVTDLLKPGADVLAQLDPTRANLIHLALGIAGEAGELVDAIKKAAIYGKQLDMENVLEELGDLEFYQGALREATGFTRAMVLEHNITKLRKRYGGSYSNEAAQERADKAHPVMDREDLFCCLCGELGHGSAQCTTVSEFKPSRKKETA